MSYEVNGIDYSSVQINGQVIITPDEIEEGDNDYELFIKGFPANVAERDILELTAKYGKIRKIRLMVTHSGLSKRFAFVEYVYMDDHITALKLLNNDKIGNRNIYCEESENMRCLLIRKLPRNCDRFKFLTELTKKVSITSGTLQFKNGEIIICLQFKTNKIAHLSRKVLLELCHSMGYLIATVNFVEKF